MRSTLIANCSWVWDANGKPLPDKETPGLDLAQGNVDSASEFWACVLLIAGRDRATSVQFFPYLGENCLFVTVNGIDYEMIPPPEDCRDWLLRAGRNLSAGSTWRGMLWGWKARVFRCESCGFVKLVWRGCPAAAERTFCIEWASIFSAKGLVFRRMSDPFAVESVTNRPQSRNAPLLGNTDRGKPED